MKVSRYGRKRVRSTSSETNKARELRATGLSYEAIGNIMNRSKQTIANWTSDVVLDEIKKKKLRDNSRKYMSNWRSSSKKVKHE